MIYAADGEQALKLAREQIPSFILLDVILPKMSGLDVLKALKNDPLTSAIPMMILTGLSLKNAKQMQKDGACGFFLKSESMLGKDPESLLAVIDRILKRTNSRQS